MARNVAERHTSAQSSRAAGATAWLLVARAVHTRGGARLAHGRGDGGAGEQRRSADEQERKPPTGHAERRALLTPASHVAPSEPPTAPTLEQSWSAPNARPRWPRPCMSETSEYTDGTIRPSPGAVEHARREQAWPIGAEADEDRRDAPKRAAERDHAWSPPALGERGGRRRDERLRDARVERCEPKLRRRDAEALLHLKVHRRQQHRVGLAQAHRQRERDERGALRAVVGLGIHQPATHAKQERADRRA